MNFQEPMKLMKWWRSWHGAPTDTKWLSIARRAKVTPGMAAAVVWALYDHASQATERGDVSRFDTEALADFYGFDEKEIRAIVSALNEKGVIDGDRLVAWDKWQPDREREDDTREKQAERQRRCRDRKRGVTPTHTTSRQVTSRVEESRGEKKKKNNTARANALGLQFEDWYQTYPRHVGKGDALKAYTAARKTTDHATLMAGVKRAVERYRDTEKQFVPHPATWLNGERWLDEHEPTPKTKEQIAEDAIYAGFSA